MNHPALKQILPHLGGILILLLVAFTYFLPAVNGKVLSRSDNLNARGMQGEMRRYIEDTGKAPLWTNSAFGGMPTYQIMGSAKGNLAHKLQKVVMFGNGVVPPHTAMFLTFVCAYLMFIVLGLDWRLGILGAIAYGLTANFVILTEAGHSTKLIALAYAPGVLAGVFLIFQKKYLLGLGVLSLFMSLEVLANHLQITYYLGFILSFFGLFQFVKTIKTKEWKHFAIACLLGLVGAGLGVMANTNRIWSTQEYAEETQRGPSELSAKTGQSGLSTDYIWNWSYGIDESFTLIIPNYKGGGTAQNIRHTEAFQMLSPGSIAQGTQQGQTRREAEESANAQIASALYWGGQPSTAGPVYYGAILLLLFVLACFLVDPVWRNWALVSLVFILFVAWGGNFKVFNQPMVDYFPMWNKFRSTTMILGLGQLVVALVGLFGLQKFFSKSLSQEARKKAITYATAIVGGLVVLLLLGGFASGFVGPKDDAYGEIASVLQDSRRALFQADAFRSLLLVSLSAGALWLYSLGKLKSVYALLIIGSLLVFDHVGVAWRYMDHEKFVQKKESGFNFIPTQADQQLLADPDPHFRVFDIARGSILFNTTTSYWHHSLSGYLSAKLQLYQELVETYFASGNIASMRPVLDMLNTKYIMTQQQEGGPIIAQPTGTNLGNAWFVNGIDLVENADAELLALATTDLKNVAVIQKKHADYVAGLEFVPDSLVNPNNKIELTYYHPDTMRYQYSADREQLAMFSEIYYPASKGWKLLVDGEPLAKDFIKADFALRAARLPAGDHQIEMIFAPRSFYAGIKFSYLGSLISLLLFFGAFGYLAYKKDWTKRLGAEFYDPETAVQEQKSAPKKTTSKKTSKGKPIKKKRK